MKKLWAVILAAALLLSSCGSGKSDTDYEPFRISSQWVNLNYGGELYTVNENGHDLLYFIDFTTLKALPVCPRPNCTHTDPDACPAMDVNNHPIIVDSKLYFFEENTFWNSENKIVTNTDIYVADIDGSNRRKLDTIEDLKVSLIDYVAISGSTLYFQGSEETFEENALVSSGLVRRYMCSYDLESKTFENHGLLCEGYSSNAIVEGDHAGGLYVSVSYTREKLDYMADDFIDNLIEATIWEVWRLDLKTGELTKSDLPTPYFVDGGYYGYNEDGKAVLIDPSGKKAVYDDYEFSGFLAAFTVNGLVFNEDDNTALDLKKGKVLSIAPDVLPNHCTVLAYLDGNYICKYTDFDLQRDIYIKISEDEMFGGADKVKNDIPLSLDDISWKTECDHPDSIALKALSSSELNEKMEADVQKYFDMLDPILSERTQRYYELLEESPSKRGMGLSYNFCNEGYYMTECFFETIYYLGGVIDTDLAADCRVDISFTEYNLETGKERKVSKTFENNDGECGLKYIIYPDKGFYIMEYETVFNFTSIKNSKSSSSVSPESIASLINMEERAILMLTGELEQEGVE